MPIATASRNVCKSNYKQKKPKPKQKKPNPKPNQQTNIQKQRNQKPNLYFCHSPTISFIIWYS